MSAFRLPPTIKITVSLSAARKLGSTCCTCWEIRGSQFVHPVFIMHALLGQLQLQTQYAVHAVALG
jgi:hypothetical protein